MMRWVYISGATVIAGTAAYFGAPYAVDNHNLTDALITTFTVFAGFLVAVIAILGDPSQIPDKKWNKAEAFRVKLETRLLRHTYLFLLYLLTVAALLVSLFISQEIFAEHTATKLWVTRAYLFLSVGGFLATMMLPTTLIRIQRSRADAEINRMRRSDLKENDSEENIKGMVKNK